MPHRVLVVDDEEAIRSLVKDYLEGQGYLVSCAGDGDEGIKVFQNEHPSLVLIDFLLPRKNGFAVAEAIRKDASHGETPIIMMSGVFKNPKTAVEAREKYRVVEFLSKPLDMDRIGSLLSRTLVDGPDDGFNPERTVDERSHDRRSGPRAASTMSSTLRDPDPPPRGLSYYGQSTAAPRAITPIPEPPAAATDKPAGQQARVRVSSSVVRDGVFMGRPFPALEEEGDLETLPIAMLLSTIRYDVVTGMLDLTDGATHRRIYVTRGLPTFMQSNAEGENVGALLLRRGRVTEPDFQRCLNYMKTKGRTLQQSLLELHLCTDHDLATAYKLLAGQLLPLALGMASGRFKWRETDAFIGRVPEGNFEPVQVLFDGIKRHVHPPQILKFFKGREDVPIVKTSEFDKLMPFFRRAFSANNIAAEIHGRVTYRDLTRKHSSQAATVVPQLFALTMSGMCVLPDVTEDNVMEVMVNAAAAEIMDMKDGIASNANEVLHEEEGELDEADLSTDERRARAAISRYHSEIMAKDFFQIFNADKSSDLDKIKSVYFDLAKRWHADAYTGMRLGAMRAQLDDIFSRITEAYDTITDKSKRDEYVVYLERQAKGLPTDVNQILKGEQLYDQAVAMIRRRDFAAARPVLEEAIKLNPGDALYYASLGWVVFNLNPNQQRNVTDGVNLLKRAIQDQENCSLAYQYLGQIAFMRNQPPEAKKWWKKCLEHEPNNIDAARGLRMIDSKEDKERSPTKSGLLGKFLNKK